MATTSKRITITLVDSDLTITCLGSGTSHGVPMIACDCPVCTSDDPRDQRTRTSVLVQFGPRSIIIDTAPEFRIQCLANNVLRLDAVLFTHQHADHVTGLDDLRRFNWIQEAAIPCYASARTAAALRGMFPYAFAADPDYPSSAPQLEFHEIDDQPFELFGRRVTPIPLMHGPLPVYGYRFGAFAYCTDCSRIPDQSWALLEDLDVLILDATRRRPHPTHFNLEQAVDAARRIAARQTFFTHIAHELGHAATNAELPDGMALAFDGQIIHLHR